MEFEQRQSGLIIQKDKPKPPTRVYGNTEIEDDDHRAMAREALLKLWDAMSLSYYGRIRLPEKLNQQLYYSTYRFIGEMLLGSDCPEKEIKT